MKDEEENPNPAPPPDTDVEIPMTMEQEASEMLTSEHIVILKKISHNLANVGLTREESCMLVNISVATLEEWMRDHEIVARIIVTMELRYKRELLRALSAKARGGDHRLATWLLEKRFPEEFGTRKSRVDDDEKDEFDQAIILIRKGGRTRDPLVIEEPPPIDVERL